MKVRAIDTADVRFPTSRTLAGSDAMHPDPDYSAAYAIVRLDARDAPDGHGLAFTIGRGNEIVVAAIEALRPLVIGRDLDAVFADMGAFSRSLTLAASRPSRASASRSGSFRTGGGMMSENPL